MRFGFAAAALAAAFAAPAAAQQPPPAAAQQPPPAAAQQPPPAPDYANEASWLCLPGRSDPCSQPLPTTALNASGYGSTGLVRPDPNPPIDCFYVYPTVSRDEGDNSDLVPGPEEQLTATVQFARFGTVCRTFAPMYRQATLGALLRNLDTRAGTLPPLDLAYEDVVAAWRHYLARHNRGRPFVLVGHSQGTIMLMRLLAREIEGSPAHRRLISALLIGFNVEVPEGAAVGGSFRETPLCTRPGQTGCVVSYVSFRATNPPPPDARFGRTATPGMAVACTNPARLRGETTPLDSYWYAGAPPRPGVPAIQWSSEGPPPTPFLRTEGLVSAACVRRDGASYLSVLINGDSGDSRTDEIPGDVRINNALVPGWGLHSIDMNVAMGDLIALVEAQSEAYRRRR
jgi:hypothetical protein